MAFSQSRLQWVDTPGMQGIFVPRRAGRTHFMLMFASIDGGVATQIGGEFVIDQLTYGEATEADWWISSYGTYIAPDNVTTILGPSQSPAVFTPSLGWLGFELGVNGLGVPLTYIFDLYETYPDTPSMKNPTCDDGSPAELTIDPFTNKITVGCGCDCPKPRVEIDLMLKRLRGRGLIDV